METQLTKKEKKVLDFLQKDVSTYHIKKTMGIKRCTVRTYCKSLYKKMGVASKKELKEVQMVLLNLAKEIIKQINSDGLYEIFRASIDEMNARKNKEILNMQQKIRCEQAVKEYSEVQYATRVQ